MTFDEVIALYPRGRGWDWQQENAFYDDLARPGPAVLVALAHETEVPRPDGKRWARDVFAGALGALIRLRGVAGARAVLELLEIDRRQSVWGASIKSRQIRAAAEGLERYQPREVFFALLTGPHTPVASETLLRWLEHLVRLGRPVDVPAVRAFLAAHAGHPLAGLSLEPLFPLAEVQDGSELVHDLGPPGPPTEALEMAVPALQTVFQHMVDATSTEVEARAFRLARPRPELDPLLLHGLGLACVGGRLVGRVVTPASAWSELYQYARAEGRDEDPRPENSRVAALAAFAALCGVDEHLPAAELAAAARRCRWLSFHARGHWFDETGWNLGLACLDERGQRVAVLAASHSYG